MTNNIYIRNIAELFPDAIIINDTRNKVNCNVIDSKIVNSQLSSPIYLNGFFTILVLAGNATIRINNKTYTVKANNIILLSVSHLFNFISCSNDFNGLCLLVSKDFMDEMDATDMIYRRIKYGVRLYSNPVMRLNEEEATIIQKRIAAINTAIDNTHHFYHKETILNSLFAYYLDLSNVIEHNTDNQNDANLTRYQSIIKSFIELLIANYRKEHRVEFYSSRLNITPHYLTLIVKRITGQTVNDFIYEMLYSEARNLLTHSKISIQEITSFLNFSDQSSFGKFFKRKSGVSPKEYRKGEFFPVDKK